ncbi:MAG: HAMP domain-containing histidine kinase, partial [Firmicutes bacterium]|nr:HAMP domain-containing histidine kinase [Bacillota bacterium]
LTEAVCESMLDFESEWENKEIEIETKLEEDLMIHGDKELLSLVWNNLMSNAIKFTPKGGKITIETGKSAPPEADTGTDGAFVRISDTGCGMDKKTLGNIFRKFFQGDTSHQQQGNGLGLSIASRVIDIHGGRIDVKSEPGKGSTFTVFL